MPLSAALIFASSVLTGGTIAAQEHSRPKPVYSPGFTERVKDYLALQRKLESGLPPLVPTEQPTRVQVHSRGLAERLRDARKDAKIGDVFGDTAAMIRQVIVADSKERSFRDAYAAMEEVPIKAPPGINADYPADDELATVPPLVLARLPILPEGLEYRFMGRDLILRDTKANIVVDIVREAIPTIAKLP